MLLEEGPESVFTTIYMVIFFRWNLAQFSVGQLEPSPGNSWAQSGEWHRPWAFPWGQFGHCHPILTNTTA